jgi:hypothetical protein
VVVFISSLFDSVKQPYRITPRHEITDIVDSYENMLNNIVSIVSIRIVDLFLEANDTSNSKGVLLRAVASDVIR